jgi:predicted nucleotidyltransferase
MSTTAKVMIERAAAELKGAGAREVYVFGSAAKGTDPTASDVDLAVSGLPPAVFYRMGARISDLLGRSVDLVDLDISTPFTRYLRAENELVQLG